MNFSSRVFEAHILYWKIIYSRYKKEGATGAIAVFDRKLATRIDAIWIMYVHAVDFLEIVMNEFAKKKKNASARERHRLCIIVNYWHGFIYEYS